MSPAFLSAPACFPAVKGLFTDLFFTDPSRSADLDDLFVFFLST